MFFKKKIYIPPQPTAGDSYKNFNHLEDDLLYTDNEYALNFLKNKNDKITKSKKIKCHAYWYGDINEKHIFSIKSLLCAQKNAEVYLWIDKSTFNNNKKNNFLKEIENDIYIYIYMKIKFKLKILLLKNIKIYLFKRIICLQERTLLDY